MSKPIVRATQLEQFRRFLSDKYDYMTEQDVVDTCTGVFEGNVKTRVGSALHHLVETFEHGTNRLGVHGNAIPGERIFTYYGKPCSEPVPGGSYVNIDDNEVVFDNKQLDIIINYAQEFPMVFHEQRIYKDYGKLVVTGCADMIDGMEIRDIKTKFSYPEDNDYKESVQWRIYCDMFEADKFSFDLFEFEDYNEQKHGYDVRGLNLHRHEPIVCYPYKNMHTEIIDIVDEFYKWAELRNVLQQLPITI